MFLVCPQMYALSSLQGRDHGVAADIPSRGMYAENIHLSDHHVPRLLPQPSPLRPRRLLRNYHLRLYYLKEFATIDDMLTSFDDFAQNRLQNVIKFYTWISSIERIDSLLCVKFLWLKSNVGASLPNPEETVWLLCVDPYNIKH